jgi:hypothetical protein
MHQLTAQPPAVADKAALALRHLIHESPNIQHFYDTYRGPVVIESVDEAVEVEDSKGKEKVTISRLHELLRPYDFIANLIVISPTLLALILFMVAVALTLVVQVVSFGTFVASVGLAVVIIFGIRKLLGANHTVDPVPIEKVQKSMRPFFKAADLFYTQVDNRVFWADRAAALQFGTFCLTLLLLFVLFDPTFLLLVSLVGLAFFERWNAFGLGSLSTILSHLILW